jgi:purine nucleoside phosphorylase
MRRGALCPLVHRISTGSRRVANPRATARSGWAPARDGRRTGITARDGATVVTVKGPRISTRAESRWFQEAGWEVINVAAYPEGWLAVRQGFAEPVPL